MTDQTYFRKRATEERAKAEAATDPSAAKAHADMAARYEQHAQGALTGLQAVRRSGKPSASSKR